MPAPHISAPTALPRAELFDVAGLGYGTPECCHLLTEVMKLAFEDRNTFTGDPDFLHIPTVRPPPPVGMVVMGAVVVVLVGSQR